ncbi:MAG: hypothetical protein FJ406_07025 [Verrucomicrobia bacterium]|nr:hypothetical protein [Verrucomicrobiota bacterium]
MPYRGLRYPAPHTMNKTLLLIICDFLLLNLLALTRWDEVEPAPSRKPPVPEVSANAARQNQDLVDMMKLALEQEQATRSQLQQRLQFAEADSQTRAQTLAQLQAQKIQLEANLKQSQTAAQDLSQRFATAAKQAADAKLQQDALTATIKNFEAEKTRLAQEMQQTVAAKQAEIQKQQAALTDLSRQQTATAQQASNLATAVRVATAEKDLIREQLEKQMQAALAAKEAELQKQQAALADLEKKRADAATQAAQFATAAKVAESERNLLRENLTDLKKEVAVVRQEKEQLQTQTAKLSEGVGQLAAKSGELAKEIRENTPINMNLMFAEFLTNRVDVAVSAQQNVLLGSGLRVREAKSVLVHDGRNVMAIVHVTDTPFSLTTPLGMDRVLARVARPPQVLGSGALTFITADPRLAVIPVSAQQAMAAGLKIYPVAKNPFKFTEAVLINRGGKHYGEVEFKLNATTPGYVKMRNRILSRVLQGEFSPSTGDLVLSKTGEFLGIMVNSEYCAVPQAYEALPGYAFDEKTGNDMVRNRLVELGTRVGRLPAALQ